MRRTYDIERWAPIYQLVCCLEEGSGHNLIFASKQGTPAFDTLLRGTSIRTPPGSQVPEPVTFVLVTSANVTEINAK